MSANKSLSLTRSLTHETVLNKSFIHYSPEKHSQERHETIEKYTIQVIELCIKNAYKVYIQCL